MEQMITLNKGGRAEKTVDVCEIRLPDTWHVLQRLLTEDTITEQQFDALWGARCIAKDLQTHIIKHADKVTQEG